MKKTDKKQMCCEHAMQFKTAKFVSLHSVVRSLYIMSGERGDTQRLDGWMDGCVDGWMDGWMDVWMDEACVCVCPTACQMGWVCRILS